MRITKALTKWRRGTVPGPDERSSRVTPPRVGGPSPPPSPPELSTGGLQRLRPAARRRASGRIFAAAAAAPWGWAHRLQRLRRRHGTFAPSDSPRSSFGLPATRRKRKAAVPPGPGLISTRFRAATKFPRNRPTPGARQPLSPTRRDKLAFDPWAADGRGLRPLFARARKRAPAARLRAPVRIHSGRRGARVAGPRDLPPQPGAPGDAPHPSRIPRAMSE